MPEGFNFTRGGNISEMMRRQEELEVCGGDSRWEVDKVELSPTSDVMHRRSSDH